MAKNSYETEIDERIVLYKRRMAECIDEAKKEVDLTHRNFTNFGTIPFDQQHQIALNALRNFQFWAHRLSEIEDVKRAMKRKQRVRRD